MTDKPYDRCIACPHIGENCDGPNFLAMTVERWIEWCRKRKERLGWTNAIISEKSNIPESTINRIFSGAGKDIRVTTMQAITKALVDGSWGQHPCANPDDDSVEECERLKAQLGRLEKVHNESKEEHSRVVAYLKDIVSDSKKAINRQKIAIVILLSILLLITVIEVSFPNMGWIRW